MGIRNKSQDSSLDTSIIVAKTHAYNIDNYTTKITFNLSDSDSLTFTNYEILKKYENIILDYCVWIKLDDKFKYRPEYLSNQLYKTTYLWYLLLFINKMDNCYQFDREYVKVLDPNSLDVLSEIYNTEKDYLKNITVDPNGLVMKALDRGSDEIIRKFGISDNIGQVEYVPPVSNDDMEGFESLIYYANNAYLIQPTYYRRAYGLTYSDGIIEGDIVSKEDQIVSFKPIFLGPECNVLINDQQLLHCPNNSKEVLTFKNRAYLRTMNKVLDTKYEISNSVNWYSIYTNALFAKISCDFSQIGTDIRVKFAFKYEGGTKYDIRNITYTSGMKESIMVVDISQNYGRLISLTISLLADFKNVDDDFKVYIDYQAQTFREENFLFNKDAYYNVKITHNGSHTNVLPLIAYKFKNYKVIDEEDLVTKYVTSKISMLPSLSKSPSTIKISSVELFEGLHLISLLDQNELKTSSPGANYLETVDTNKLHDKNDKLLLYKRPANTGDVNNFKINDYYISANISCMNNIPEENGAMGFFIKGRTRFEENAQGLMESKSMCYLYMVKLENEYTDKDKCLLSGLYKLDPSAENMDLDSGGINFKNLVKIADTSQRISGNSENSTFIKIITRGNNIKIYDNKSSKPLIDFYDSDEIKFEEDEQPTFGLAMFNIRNPHYRNLIVMGREE